MLGKIRSAILSGGLVAAMLVGCGGEDPSAPGGAGGRGGAGGAGGSGAGGEGPGGGGGGDPCAEGARAAARLGPEGGALELCGAKLEVPAGALGEGVEFAIERVAPPVPAPYETEYTGGVFRFTPDDVSFEPPIDIRLPHGGADGRILLLQQIEGEWNSIEACGVDEQHIHQAVYRLGTFTAVRDIIDWPDGPSGLGDGTLSATWRGSVEERSIDEGYAIYDQSEDGSRSYTMVFRTSYGSRLENFDIRVAAPAQGEASLLQVVFVDTGDPSGGFSYVTAVHTGGTVTLETSAEGRLRGTIGATLYRGATAEPFQGTFDVRAERFRFPQELSCNNQPEG